MKLPSLKVVFSFALVVVIIGSLGVFSWHALASNGPNATVRALNQQKADLRSRDHFVEAFKVKCDLIATMSAACTVGDKQNCDDLQSAISWWDKTFATDARFACGNPQLPF